VIRRVCADQRGAALPLTLLSLPLLILLLALAADAGALFAARGLAHASADLAALAGVQELDLERLAAGERFIMPGAAAAWARQVALANLEGNIPRLPGAGAAPRVEVLVVNASPASPRQHPWTGRPLYDPTVAVRVAVPVPLAFSGPGRSLWVTARADASVLPRRRK